MVMAEKVVTKRWSTDGVFFSHCKDYLPNSTFYWHKRTSYNPVSCEWQKKDEVDSRPRCRRGMDMGMDVVTAAESSSEEEEEQTARSLDSELEPEGK